jgi:hypothetical protein
VSEAAAPMSSQSADEKREKPPPAVVIGPTTAAFLLAVIGIFIFLCVVPTVGNIQREYGPRCRPPIGGFSEANLVGTWAKGVPDQKDTLIIGADKTYKQIVHIEFTKLPMIDYESDWQPWHLEYSKDNIPYLHLTGYAFCGMNPSIPCERRDGGGYDFCQDKYVPMNGEGILVVIEGWQLRPGTSERQYNYSLFYPLGSENSYAYNLREP